MRFVVLLAASGLLGFATALALKQEMQDENTIYQRDDPSPFFFLFVPYPANQSSIVGPSTAPSDAPPQDLTVNVSADAHFGEIPRGFIEQKCNFGQKQKILAAWDEAKLLADAQTLYNVGYNYDIPHSQWLGKSWNDESSWIPWRYDYRSLILDNSRRLLQPLL